MDINRYAYAGNDPINQSDANGHSYGSSTPGGSPDNINGNDSKRKHDRGSQNNKKDKNIPVVHRSSKYVVEEFFKGIAQQLFQSTVNNLHYVGAGMAGSWGTNVGLSSSQPPDYIGLPSSYWNLEGRQVAPGIAAMLGGKFGSEAALPKSIAPLRGGTGLGANPFKGKSVDQIERMFGQKGFSRRGPDPASGLGGYVNKETTRSYHIDPSNKFGEPSHVDVNRLKNYIGSLEKKKYYTGE